MVLLITPEDGSPIQLVLSSSGTLKANTLEALRGLTAADYTVVMITVTLPYIVVRRIFETQGINPEKIHIIDAVTKYSGGETPESGGMCTFISNPGNLTDIGIAANEVLRRIPEGKKCVVLDDISTLLLYSSSATIMKFVHFITNKLRILDVRGVLFAVEKGLAPPILAQLSTFSDTVVRADEEAPGTIHASG